MEEEKKLNFDPSLYRSLLDKESNRGLDEEELTLLLNGNTPTGAPVSLFQKVREYADVDIPYPMRKTPFSAGYDMVAAEDVIIPPYTSLYDRMKSAMDTDKPLTLSEMADLTKALKTKPTLIPTGYKCYCYPGQYIELSIRSSGPLKHWLILANGTGKVDADYVDNEDNEGHIFFQVINLSPFPIKIQKGEAIGQAIITPYSTLDADLFKPDKRAGGFGSTTNEAPSTGSEQQG